MNFVVLTCNLNLLQDAFEKLNIKCQKYGNETLSFIVVKNIDTEYSEIQVSGMTPKVGNYQLVAVISELEGKNIIHNVPGEELPVEYRTNSFTCDHCNINRYRKEVVVVRDGTTYKQLGKTCLKDYLGTSLENLVNRFSWLNELLEEARSYDFGPRGEYVVNPIEYLTYVNMCIRKFGYVKSNSQDGNPTKDLAFNIMVNPSVHMHKFIVDNKLYVEEKDKQVAIDTLEYIKNMADNSDFTHNVKTIASANNIAYKHLGYIACMIPIYTKYQYEQERKVNAKPSNWVGEVKSRINVIAKLVFQKEVFTSFGVSKLYKFIDENGNILSWFSTKDLELDSNEEYNVIGTVKDHSTYNDEKQTLLTRCKVDTIQELVI